METQAGLFIIHQLDGKVFFEIPIEKLNKDMLKRPLWNKPKPASVTRACRLRPRRSLGTGAKKVLPGRQVFDSCRN